MRYANGILIRDYFTSRQIQYLYSKLSAIRTPTPSGRYVIHAYHNNVYTGKSNAQIPPMLSKAYRALMREYVGADAVANSMICASMIDGMKPHVDQYVNWGMSISIGAPCLFTIDGVRMTLVNGDIMIADFGKHLHSVDFVSDDAPAWFAKKSGGMNRFIIQLRHVERFPDPISSEEFVRLF